MIVHSRLIVVVFPDQLRLEGCHCWFQCSRISSRAVLEGHDGSLDDVGTLSDLVVFNDEGRGQTDDVTVGGLGQQSVVTETHAHSPGIIV